MSDVVSPNPCPCCGYLVFPRPPGSYDICPVCDWQDDALQLEFADTLDGGANRPTLADAQRDFAEAVRRALHVPPADLPRDPLWRPVDPALDTFENWDDPPFRRAPDDDGALYYWRPTFWRRARA